MTAVIALLFGVVSSVSYASGPTVISGQVHSFGGGEARFYLALGAQPVLQHAKNLCAQSGERLDQISDITVHVEAPFFAINDDKAPTAQANPRVSSSAQVTCK